MSFITTSHLDTFALTNEGLYLHGENWHPDLKDIQLVAERIDDATGNLRYRFIGENTASVKPKGVNDLGNGSAEILYEPVNDAGDKYMVKFIVPFDPSAKLPEFETGHNFTTGTPEPRKGVSPVLLGALAIAGFLVCKSAARRRHA